MPYVINVEARTEGRPAPPQRRTIDAARLTIGRAPECSLRLKDAKKTVSRLHAVVDIQGAGHVLTVMSQINPVLVNGVRIGPGESAPVKTDDVIEVGDFAMQVLEVHEAPRAPLASSTRQVASSPFDFGLGDNSNTEQGDDPFRALDDLIQVKPKPAAPAGPDPFQLAPRKSDGLVEGVGRMSHLDLDLGREQRESADPLLNILNTGERAGKPAAPTFNPQPLGPSALDQILGGSPKRSAGQPLVDLSRHHAGGSSNVDHVQPINMPFNAPRIRGDAAQTPRPPAPPPVSSPVDPFDGFDPFGSMLKPRSAAPAAPPPASSTSGGAAAALAAFLEGAGLEQPQMTDAEAEAFLRESGAIVRASVEGLIGLLLARSELKKEMRAEERTMVAARDNNPLKLMTDPQEAMGYLFGAREGLSGAFLPPVQAVLDACDDLRVHEIALMAGMRAAFHGALKRFDPKLLERQVDKQTGSFSINKKVKLWDAFLAHHGKLSRDAEDDLLKVFGKDFLGTYMAQVRRLRSGR
jgi:type VI secretion system FHA domain protein